MNTKFNMTIELTEADVKQAIAEYVTRHLQEASLEINAKDVNFATTADGGSVKD